MLYSNDSKIRPETLAAMGTVTPAIPEFEDGFTSAYGRANAEQRELYNPTLDLINTYFKNNWASMTNTEKMKWKYQRYMQDYLACISSIDDNVGRVLDYLEESGLAKNTIVIYTSDQGFFLGEHGWFDKRFIYNESFKTPLLIRWPKKIKAGAVEDELVQNLDYAQTFLEAAGIHAPAGMQGESLMSLLMGRKENWKRDALYYHYYEYPDVHMVKRHYGVVTKEFKLIHFYFDVDEWELYDRVKDPGEMKNVYNETAYKETIVTLKEKLVELRAKYRDSVELDRIFIDMHKR
jgi:arylsulfatase A-like enzyme